METIRRSRKYPFKIFRRRTFQGIRFLPIIFLIKNGADLNKIEYIRSRYKIIPNLNHFIPKYKNILIKIFNDIEFMKKVINLYFSCADHSKDDVYELNYFLYEKEIITDEIYQIYNQEIDKKFTKV